MSVCIAPCVSVCERRVPMCGCVLRIEMSV